MDSSITPELIHELDPSQVYGSVLAFPDQVLDSWEQSEKIALPPHFDEVENIIVAAMGGSALGARLLKAVYQDTRRIPLEIVNDYNLPGYAGPKTLVIADSYSGNTEETLSAYAEAVRLGAKVFVIATGEKLDEAARRDKVPAFVFDPVHNPSRQPRMALGYAIGAVAEVFSKLGILNLNKSEIEKAVSFVKNLSQSFTIDKGESEAKKMAEGVQGKIPVLIGSSHLLGAIHAMKNQINENAKNFAALFPIPELNHHLMEGLKFPEGNQKNLVFVFFESTLYHPRVQKRHTLTKQLIENYNLNAISYQAKGTNKLEQALEIVSFGAFVGFYLSMLNGVNPAPIPTVDWFKRRMG